MQVQSLGEEDPREKEMATHFSVLSWEIPWSEEPDWHSVHGIARVRHNLATEEQTPCSSQRKLIHNPLNMLRLFICPECSLCLVCP